MINVKNISKTYKMGEITNNVLNIDEVNIEKGDFWVIVGPSGSGKSTFLNIISLIDKDIEGQLWYENKNLLELSERERVKFRRENIGYIFQSFNLLPHLTALENVILPMIPYESKAKLKEKGQELLKEVGLEQRINHLPTQMSGGEQQRVAIARALINNAPLIIGDEPTGNLDSGFRDDIVDILLRLNDKGHTIVLATHDLDVAKKAKKKLVLKDGKILSMEGI